MTSTLIHVYRYTDAQAVTATLIHRYVHPQIYTSALGQAASFMEAAAALSDEVEDHEEGGAAARGVGYEAADGGDSQEGGDGTGEVGGRAARRQRTR